MASTAPLKPARHLQPLGTLVPEESFGQAAAWQLPVKKGEALLAVILPLNPASQVQPVGTSVPLESVGHCTAVQPFW